MPDVTTTGSGDIDVDADADAQIVSVGIGAAWTRTSGTAVGASLSANIVVKSISATVTSDPPDGNSVTLTGAPTISSAGDLSVSATDTTVITAVNGGGAVAGGESTGAGAAIAVNVVAVDTMQAVIDGGSGGGSGLVVDTGGDVDVSAAESSQIVSVAAGFALGNTSWSARSPSPSSTPRASRRESRAVPMSRPAAMSASRRPTIP